MTITHTRRRRGFLVAASVAAILGLGLTACSADSGGTGAAGEGGAAAADCADFAQDVRIAQAPVSDFAPVWVALEEGFFEDNGLTVELGEPGGTGAESVALINSGQVDMVAGSPSAMLLAAAQGIMTQVVSGMTTFPDAEDRDPAIVVVRADSGITRLADLEGKTVGVTSINSQQQTKVMGAVKADGGDPGMIEFIQVPTPSMGALVESGEIDAAQPFEPVGTQLVGTGDFKAIGYANWQSIGGAPAMFLASTPDWIEENACAVGATQTAIANAVDFINDDANRDRFIEILAEYTKADPAVLADARMDDYTVEFSEDDYDKLMKHLMEFGVLAGEVDVAPLIGE
jgi:NitT/TauT family transport system substrate-binding protein